MLRKPVVLLSCWSTTQLLYHRAPLLLQLPLLCLALKRTLRPTQGTQYLLVDNQFLVPRAWYEQRIGSVNQTLCSGI